MESHPLAEKFPLMSKEEYAALVANMKANGFNPKFPIYVYKRKVLDGRNRLKAAKEAGVKAKYVKFEGTEEEADVFVDQANEHRRHLALEFLKKRRDERIARVNEALANGATVREVAEKEGISTAQVQRDKNLVTYVTKPLCKGCARKVRTGKKPVDGCKDCADLPETEEAARLTKPKPKKKPKKHRPELTDALGTPLPTNCRDAWADHALPDLIEELDSVRSVMEEPYLKRIEKIASHYPFLLVADFQKHLHDAQEGIQNALESLRAGVPYALCPKCAGVDPGANGKACRTCRGSGLIPKHKIEEN